jgi:ribosomal protein L21E
MPHRRFNGLVGTVKEVGVRSLIISVPVGDKVKTVVARKDHIAPLKGPAIVLARKDHIAPLEGPAIV